MKTTYKPSILILLCMLLPGCGRIVDWGKTNFYQAKELTDFSDEIKPCLRTITIYDQLETKAIFDALWLSDAVRMAYAKLHTLRQGKNEEKYQLSLRRQLEENNHYVTFYILSTYEVKLGVPESQWSFFLLVDGREYHPFELKEIELPYEYQLFFGKRWNRFKVPYLIRFKSMTDDEQIIKEEANSMSLIVRSGQKEHVFVWKLANEPLLTESPQPVKMSKKKAKKKKEPQVRVPRKTRS